jgi:formylglycine-generating enzyme required for sulfatase activity
MRLFVSYARVDKPYCIQIVDTLDVHDTWYDQRLYAGQNWWKEILRRLDWCEGFVYLLSADSVTSEYCRKEFELAQSLGRHIFPVVIESDVAIPESLAEVQYADFSSGLTPDSVKVLLNSIYIAERQNGQRITNLSVASISSNEIEPPAPDQAMVISSAAEAMEKSQFDKAVFLLKQARANNFVSRFIDLDALLNEALAGLERQTYLREAEREYRQISGLVKYSRTRKLGIQAFKAFREDYPDYDPHNLAEYCNGSTPDEEQRFSFTQPLKRFEEPVRRPSFRMHLLQWCEIPPGIVHVGNNTQNSPSQEVHVDGFQMAKYLVTNQQYQTFLNDPDGYANIEWWSFSPFARTWREETPEPKASQFDGDERPREMANWYDAMAFCNWLSARLEQKVTLPTINQWLRAARGDDQRVYPWGSKFDETLCNTNQSKLKMTSNVTRYPNGASPFGVFDMAGNVWEWCLNPKDDTSDEPEIITDADRAVHGGSYIGPADRAKISFRYYLKPKLYYSSIGFRVIKLP